MASSFDVTANVKLNSANLNANAKKIELALGRITGQASEFQKSLDASTARVFAFGATTAILNSVNQAFKKLVSTTIEVEKRLIENLIVRWMVCQMVIMQYLNILVIIRVLKIIQRHCFYIKMISVNGE